MCVPCPASEHYVAVYLTLYKREISCKHVVAPGSRCQIGTVKNGTVAARSTNGTIMRHSDAIKCTVETLMFEQKCRATLDEPIRKKCCRHISEWGTKHLGRPHNRAANRLHDFNERRTIHISKRTRQY